MDKKMNWSEIQQVKSGTLERNKYICRLVNARGKGTQAKLARHYGLTRQRINQIYKRGKKENFVKRLWDWIKGK